MKKLFLIVLVFVSCSFAEEYSHMKAPEVSDCSYGECCIQITFSSEMERGITEQAFSCLCNDEAASGTFIWYEKKMCFYPEGGIKDKSRYEVEVGDDVDSNTLLPNMLLHTYCQNAVKHGIQNKPGGNLPKPLLRSV